MNTILIRKDETVLCPSCETPHKNGMSCHECDRIEAIEQKFDNEFMKLDNKMTFHMLQYFYDSDLDPDIPYNYNACSTKLSTTKLSELKLSYIKHMNIIIDEICNQYCVEYNNVYNINFIKPLWHMIFEFAPESHSDMLLFNTIDYPTYIKTDKEIKHALLNLIDISHQLSKCTPIPIIHKDYLEFDFELEYENNINIIAAEASVDVIDRTNINEFECFLNAPTLSSHGNEITVTLAKSDVKTIKDMIQLIDKQDKKFKGKGLVSKVNSWLNTMMDYSIIGINNMPTNVNTNKDVDCCDCWEYHGCKDYPKLTSKELIHMAKKCQFFKDCKC